MQDKHSFVYLLTHAVTLTFTAFCGAMGLHLDITLGLVQAKIVCMRLCMSRVLYAILCGMKGLVYNGCVYWTVLIRFN